MRWRLHIHTTHINVHQTRNRLLMRLTVMRQRQSAGLQSLQATDRQAEHVKSPFYGTEMLMSPQINLAAANCNWSFSKTRVSGRWVKAGMVEPAAVHTNAATETQTSFIPVSVWLLKGSTELLKPKKFRPGEGRPRLQRLWWLGGSLAAVTVGASGVKNAQMPQHSRILKECKCEKGRADSFFTVRWCRDRNEGKENNLKGELVLEGDPRGAIEVMSVYVRIVQINSTLL